MAVSGECYSNEYNNRGIGFFWSRTGYNSTNSTTDIYWELRGTGSRSGYYVSGNFRVNISGSDVYSSATRINLYNGTVIASGTRTIQMNNDGSGGFSVYIEAGVYTYAVNVSGSSNFTLDTIPRYANITSFSVSKRDETSVTINWGADTTCDYGWYSINNGASWVGGLAYPNQVVSGLAAGTVYNIKIRVRRADSQLVTESGTWGIETYYYPHVVGANSVTIGDAFNISVYNPLGRTYYLELISTQNNQTFAAYNGAINGSVIGFNDTSAINRLYESIPNSKSGSYRTKLTYGSHIHENDPRGTGTYTIRGNEVPTFTNWTYEDVNSTTTTLTGNNQIIVKGYSSVKAIVTTANKMVANNSANPSYYQLSIGSANPIRSNYSSSSTVNIGNLTATTNSFDLYAVDSRQLSKKVNKTVSSSNYKNYFNISIDSASAIRSGNVGSETTLNFSGKIWNSNFGNKQNSIKSLSVKYKLTNEPESSYTSITVEGSPTLSSNTFSYSHTIDGDLEGEGYSITNSFNIKITISDELSTHTQIITLGSGRPLIAKHRNGVNFGGPYDVSNGGSLQLLGVQIPICLFVGDTQSIMIPNNTRVIVPYTSIYDPLNQNTNNGYKIPFDGFYRLSCFVRFSDYSSQHDVSTRFFKNSGEISYSASWHTQFERIRETNIYYGEFNKNDLVELGVLVIGTNSDQSLSFGHWVVELISQY